MSIKVMARVWETSSQSGSSLLVLLAMADWSRDDGWCWPSIERLAQKARVSERTVQYALRAMVAAGEIEERRGGAGRGNQSFFKICCAGDDEKGAESAPKAPTKRVQNTTRKGASVAPNTLGTRQTSNNDGSSVVGRSGARDVNLRADGAARAPRARKPLFDAFVATFEPGVEKPSRSTASLAGDFDKIAGALVPQPTPDDWNAWVERQKRPDPRTGVVPWGRFVLPHNARARFVADWQIQHPQGAASNVVYDHRFFFQDDLGRWRLKDIALVTLPAPYNRLDPETWPPEMVVAYETRLAKTPEGRMVLA